jgi:hypothetical protein
MYSSDSSFISILLTAFCNLFKGVENCLATFVISQVGPIHFSVEFLLAIKHLCLLLDNKRFLFLTHSSFLKLQFVSVYGRRGRGRRRKAKDVESQVRWISSSSEQKTKGLISTWR